MDARKQSFGICTNSKTSFTFFVYVNAVNMIFIIGVSRKSDFLTTKYHFLGKFIIGGFHIKIDNFTCSSFKIEIIRQTTFFFPVKPFIVDNFFRFF